MAQVINSENFDTLSASGKLIVIDFWATWCGPCKRMAPIFDQLAQEYEDTAIMGKCDIEEDEDLPVRLGVRNIPTIILVKDGQVVDKQVGLCPKATLEEKIKTHL